MDFARLEPVEPAVELVVELLIALLAFGTLRGPQGPPHTRDVSSTGSDETCIRAERFGAN